MRRIILILVLKGSESSLRETYVSRKHAPLAMIEIASDEHVTFIVNLTEVHRGIIFVNALKHINVLTSKF